jgi:hypothetical protein
LPFGLFKAPAEKAEDEWTKAYQKGVNLGRQKWPDAVSHFMEASKAYGEAGNQERQREAYALAAFFNALVRNDPQSWLSSSQATAAIGDTQLNIGFNASAADISRQSQVMRDDIVATDGVKETGGSYNPEALRQVAKEYMELTGADLVVWKILKEEVDPARRANYFLGLASLNEANALVQKDPRKAVAMLSQAVTHFDISESDPLGVKGRAKDLRDRASVSGKCWICGREVQGKDIHFVTLPAEVSEYMREKHGSSVPSSLIENGIVACKSCFTSVRNLADSIALAYYNQAIQELRQTEGRLNARINSLSQQVQQLETRIRQVAR